MRVKILAKLLMTAFAIFSAPASIGDYLQSSQVEEAPAPSTTAAVSVPGAHAETLVQRFPAASRSIGEGNLVAVLGAAEPKPDLSGQRGEWIFQCWKEPVRSCQILQRRIEAKTRQQLILVAIAFYADGSRRMTMITPLGFKSNLSLAVSMDNAPSIELPLKTCLSSGCLQIGDISRSMLEKLQKSNRISIFLQGIDGQNFNLNIPLKGLKGALATISQYIVA